MKKHFLFASLAIATLFTACSQEEELNVNTGNTPVNFAIEGVGSRTVTTFENDTYSTVFSVGDNVGIYAFGGAEKTNSKFTVAEGIKLKGEAISYKENVSTSFKAYYPYADNGASTVKMTVGNQETGIDAYDFMTAAPAAVTTENTVNFKFVHRFAMVQVRVTGFIGETAKKLFLKNIKPTITWTAESDAVSEAEGTPTDIAMYNIKDNYFVALVPVQTLAAKTPMFYTTIGDKVYTFSPNKEISLTANKIAQFTIEIGSKVDMDMEGSSPEIGDWDNTGEEDGDFDMGADDVPAAPAVELISANDFSTAVLGTPMGGISSVKTMGWAQVGATANATVTLANGALTINAPSTASSSWYNRCVIFRSAPISNVTKFTLKFTVKSDKAEGTSDLQLAVMMPEASANTFFKLNSTTAANYCSVSNAETEKNYTIDLSVSKPENADFTNGILLMFTSKEKDDVTYTITNLTLVETKE